MLFSNLVATLRADLETIRDDLGEFVTTVKTDTTSMLGLNGDGSIGSAPGANGSKVKYVLWEEELWDNPELLCEDPQEENWQSLIQVNDEEAETLLAGAGGSDIIPELYRELVPSRTTHADFFKRLFYHRFKMNQALKAKMQELVRGDKEEEETGWEDDDIDETPVAPRPEETPKPQQHVDSASATTNNTEEYARLLQAKDDEMAECKKELDGYKQIVDQLQSKVVELEKLLKASDALRSDLELKLAQQAMDAELPHKKPAQSETKTRSSSTSTLPAEAPSPVSRNISQQNPIPSATPASITSWEALPTSPASSNEEPIVVMPSKAEEEEEADWE